MKEEKERCPKCGTNFEIRKNINGKRECSGCHHLWRVEPTPPAVAQERPTPRAEALEATPLFSGRPRSPECAEALLELRKAERELAEANEKLADWRGAGMKIGVLLVTSGSKSDGIVDGVRELLANSKSQAEEIERLRGAIKTAVESFEKIRWGNDGDCGSSAVVDRLEKALSTSSGTRTATQEAQGEIDKLRTEINSFIASLPGGQSVDPQSVADDLREILVATSPQKP